MAFKTVVTHDFTDKTTWYQKATKVTAESHVSALGIINLDHDNVIDIEHGKITGESSLSDDYKVVITKSGVTQNGYTLNYATGQVSGLSSGTFLTTYYYAGDSTFTLGPASGKIWEIEKAKFIGSSNIGMTETSIQIWVTNPADPPNKVEVTSERRIHKNIHDVINMSDDLVVLPKYSLFSNDIIMAKFNYIRSIPLQYVGGAEIRIVLKDDTAMSGEYGAMSFSIVERDA